MGLERTEVQKTIQEFVANPQDRILSLDVAWVAQINRDFPKHLSCDESLFLCGTPYVHEENTDGRLMEIALEGRNVGNLSTHSVKFMFSEDAQFVLCKKCLKWLRKQLRPLENSVSD